MLVLCLLMFSVVPLAFVTGYSIIKYEQAIDQELSTRLLGNAREISVILNDFQTQLINESRQISADKALIFYMGSNNIAQAREGMKRWFNRSVSQRVWVYNRDARLEVALYKDDKGQIQRRENLENVVELTEGFLKSMNGKDELLWMDVSRSTNGKANDAHLEFSVLSKIVNPAGKVFGYVEEAITLDETTLRNLRNRLNAEIFFFKEGKSAIVATHEDLSLYRVETFLPHLKEDGLF